MKVIDGVRLRNFRCHDEFALSCRKLTTLIVGENGSGKTSVLEALYLALRGKSFKGVDREMIRKGADFYRVELKFNDGDMISISWNGRNKEFSRGDKKMRRLPKQWKYPVILFEPDDLHLVGTAPGRRREYFDRLFGQIDESYSVVLGKYEKALKQRNDLLRNEIATADNVFSWNVMLAKYGVELILKRRAVVERVNAEMTGVYREIAKNDDSCSLLYQQKDLDEGQYLTVLVENLEKDQYLGYTSFGVHRDDYLFWFNNSLADGSASRGEIRSMMLALKFIEAKMVTEETGKAPVVLLDDIFSELDEKRQRHLIENFKDYQMIVTSTAIPGEMRVDKRL